MMDLRKVPALRSWVLFALLGVSRFVNSSPVSSSDDTPPSFQEILPKQYNPAVIRRSYGRVNQTHFGYVPLNVEVNMYVRDIEEINEFRQEVTYLLTLRQKWHDNRLGFKSIENDAYVNLRKQDFQHIWIPDTFIGNERSGSFHNLLEPNVLVRVYSNGTVYYSVRITATVKCDMNFEAYPFDTQECPIIFASYGLTTKRIKYTWKSEHPIAVAKNALQSQFTLESFIPKHMKTVTTATGAYGYLNAVATFKRSSNIVLGKTFFPTAIFVVIAWMSFWMSPLTFGPRSGVLLASLLAMSLTSYMVLDSLPAVSYTRAVDIWMNWCFAFILYAIFEFLAVVVATNVVKHKNEAGEKINLNALRIIVNYMSVEKHPSSVDTIHVVIFPIAFFLFIIAYFVHY